MQIKISRLIELGDSMTDEGRMDHKYLFVFPVFSTDLNKSRLGRFIKERVWLDFVVQFAIQQLMSLILEKAALDQEEITDLAIADYYDSLDLDNLAQREFEHLNYYRIAHQGTNIHFSGKQVCRNYATGGATAAHYLLMRSLRSGLY